MPAENLADYFSQRAHACSSVSSEPRKQAVATVGENILSITSDVDRTVADIDESERLARLSLSILYDEEHTVDEAPSPESVPLPRFASAKDWKSPTKLRDIPAVGLRLFFTNRKIDLA